MKTDPLFRIPRIVLAAVLCASVVLLFHALGNTQEARPGDAGGAAVLVCVPDEASLYPGEVTAVRVLMSPKSEEPLSYRWSATAGRIKGQGAQAKWSFSEVKPGLYTATVRVRNQKSTEVKCEVRVAVNERTGIRGRKTGWHLLVKGKQEGQGYGLYSYVLFGSKPEGAERERCIKGIEAYLSLMPSIVGLEAYSPKKELNITYLPVLEENPEAADDPKEKMTPEWVLRNYDLARASSILAKLEGNYRDGPYILSFLSPPLKSASAPRPYLAIDLSNVPPNLIRGWIKEFLNQAAQERFWEKRPMPRFLLTLRTGIEVVSLGLPEAKKAASEWVTLVK